MGFFQTGINNQDVSGKERFICKKLEDWADAIFDWNWSPDKCFKCEFFGKCNWCYFTKDQKIDLGYLTFYTVVPNLWYLFQQVTRLSPVRENGYSLDMLDFIVKNSNLDLLKSEMMLSLGVFLDRKNFRYLERKNKQ